MTGRTNSADSLNSAGAVRPASLQQDEKRIARTSRNPKRFARTQRRPRTSLQPRGQLGKEEQPQCQFALFDRTWSTRLSAASQRQHGSSNITEAGIQRPTWSFVILIALPIPTAATCRASPSLSSSTRPGHPTRLKHIRNQPRKQLHSAVRTHTLLVHSDTSLAHRPFGPDLGSLPGPYAAAFGTCLTQKRARRCRRA